MTSSNKNHWQFFRVSSSPKAEKGLKSGFFGIDRETEPLRMSILGPGGTGKSKIIGATTETFQYYEKKDILAKWATTGIAATGIEGNPLHS